MELFGHMDQNKDHILYWPLCQVKIIVTCSGAALYQGKLEDPDLLSCRGQDTPEP